MTTAANAHFRSRMRAISASLVLGAAIMGTKFLTYHLTGSSAVLSDALESIINVVASAFAMISIWTAAKPPDADHPYGHGKIEFFSAGFEGALIILAALGIFHAGITGLLNPRPLPHLGHGLLILLAASLVNLLLGLWLVRIGRRTRSLALEADGRHILTDVITSAGVLAGLALAWATGWIWLDGVLALLVGIHILITGTRLVRQAFAGLMDTYDPKILDGIAKCIETNRRPAWVDIHHLRAQRSGSLLHVDLHLVLPRHLSLDDAHHEAKHLEHLIVAHFDNNASVLVHMDPCEDPECPVCRQDPCRLRSQNSAGQTAWTREVITRVSKNSR